MRPFSQGFFISSREARNDHYEIKEALDEKTSYQAANLHSIFGIDKHLSLDTTLRRSLIGYRDERNDFDQVQDLNEIESVLLGRVSPYYSAGVGFRSLDGKRNGPLLMLVRRPDERAEAQGKISYLKGEDNDQILGSFHGLYRITRQLEMSLSMEQGVDLLAAYSSISVTGRTDVRQTRITKSYEGQLIYSGQYSKYTLFGQANRQDYEQSYLTQKEVRIVLDTPFHPYETLLVTTRLRHYVEDGNVLRPVDRRQWAAELQWRHYFSNASRPFEARLFSELGGGYERLWEGSRERERETFRIAFGQEWK